jgi:hypothetical protein
MISIRDTIINDTDTSESTKNDINKILFRDINYCHTTFDNGFISRNVNYYIDNNEDENVYSKLMNDCVVIPKYEKDEKDKYRELILEKKESSDESADEETIDQLIINIERDIANLDKKIGNVVKQTYILNYSLPKEYDPVENDPEFKALKDQTIKIIDEGINKKFKHFNKTDL